MLKLGLVTYNLAKNWDLKTILERLESHQIEAIEFRTTHLHGIENDMNSTERKNIRDRLEKSTIQQVSLGSACEYHSNDPDEVVKNIIETKKFIKLANDIGAIGVKVRPNGFNLEKGVSRETTLEQIGNSLKECGKAAEGTDVSIWLEVHGKETNHPPYIAEIMKIADHPNVGVCWNSNPEDIVDGSVKTNFDLLSPWLMSVHINNLWDSNYPYRELFKLLAHAQYQRYCLAEIAEESLEPDTFLKYYKSLFQELSR